MTDRYAYCSIQDVIDRVFDSDTSVTSTEKLMLLGIVQAVAAFINDFYGERRFIPGTAARRFDGSGTARLFVDDLLAVTSLVDDDDTWAASDYLLYPRNAGGVKGPYIWIEIDPDGTYSAFTGERDTVVITGRWGAYEETVATGATLASALTASATSMSVATGSIIRAGHILLIDSEQIFVTDRTTGETNDTYTIERGINGTTAATHNQSAAISQYRPPYDIFELAVELAVRLFKMKDAGYQDGLGAVELGQMFYRRSVQQYMKTEAPPRWHRSGLGAA